MNCFRQLNLKNFFLIKPWNIYFTLARNLFHFYFLILGFSRWDNFRISCNLILISRINRKLLTWIICVKCPFPIFVILHLCYFVFVFKQSVGYFVVYIWFRHNLFLIATIIQNTGKNYVNLRLLWKLSFNFA